MMERLKYGTQRKVNCSMLFKLILTIQGLVGKEIILSLEDLKKSFIFGKLDFTIV